MNYTLEQLEEAVRQELIAQSFPGLANHTLLPKVVCKIAYELYNPVKAGTEINEEQVISNYKQAQEAESKAEDALFDYFRSKFEEVKGVLGHLREVHDKMPQSYSKLVLWKTYMKPLIDEQLNY